VSTERHEFAVGVDSDPEALAEIGRRLHLPLSERQLAALAGFAQLLRRWNATYNLTSIRDPALVLTHHLADCLAAVAPLEREAAVRRRAGLGVQTVLDVGSGGGLPGVVLAIACPTLEVTCVDAVGKKAAFVRQVALELGLANLHPTHARVEQLAGRFDVVTSRAFATLADFAAMTRDRLAQGGCWMAMKGRNPGDEVAALPADVEVFHVEPVTVPDLDAERCLVWMRPR
jgi:16S rRNA (guanine527-N7)-methyltransferase